LEVFIDSLLLILVIVVDCLVISKVLVVVGVLVDVISDGDVSVAVSLIVLVELCSVVETVVVEGDVDSGVVLCSAVNSGVSEDETDVVGTVKVVVSGTCVVTASVFVPW
jgi:hypothetical protein